MYEATPIPTPVSGFVLAGGKSRRMGQNKALLEYQGVSLVEWVAGQVLAATGNVTLLGDPEIYHTLGFPVVPDFHKGRGPIGGLHAALSTMASDWCLLVACDFPNIQAALLRQLIEYAVFYNKPCVAAAEDGDQVQPLCAVYRRDCLDAVEKAISGGDFRMRTLAAGLNATAFRAVDANWIRNINTLDQWHTHLSKQGTPTE